MIYVSRKSVVLGVLYVLAFVFALPLNAATISSYSTAQGTSAGVGATAFKLDDVVKSASPYTNVSGVNGSSLVVQSAAKVDTKFGAVDAVIKREIPYAAMVSPWKKLLRAAPIVGNGLLIYEVLKDMCLSWLPGGGTAECIMEDKSFPSSLYYANGSNPYRDVSTDPLPACQRQSPGAVVDGFASEGVVKCALYIGLNKYSMGTISGTYMCPSQTVAGEYYSVNKGQVCVVSTPSPIPGTVRMTDAAMDSVIDAYATKFAQKLPQSLPRLWNEIQAIPGAAIDVTNVSPGALTGPSSLQGPQTSAPGATGTNVTNNVANITYAGTTATVTYSTTVNNTTNGVQTTISQTTETSSTECQTDPTRIGCLHLGEATDAPVPKDSKDWDIKPINLGFGGVCPAGFVWPVPGRPSFSWVPLCDRLPAARAVVLVLASVIAVSIVAKGFSV